MATSRDIRRNIAVVHTLWNRHSPATPMYLLERLDDAQPDSMTVASFCVDFVLMQRARRVQRHTESRCRTRESTSGGRVSSPRS